MAFYNHWLSVSRRKQITFDLLIAFTGRKYREAAAEITKFAAAHPDWNRYVFVIYVTVDKNENIDGIEVRELEGRY